ncbi:MAG: helix-turn-helix domain-containing protein [Gammaproteobacteria bacterium]|nr:helix-turn-helix domain-containing protein [Gammaproteobacteria bacterium]
MMRTDRWLTVDELAGYLKLSRSKLYRMAQDGDVPASKVASQWRFDRDEIDQWMKSQRLDADDGTCTESNTEKRGEG